MTAAASLTPTIGVQPVGNFSTAVEVAQSASGYVPAIALGTIMTVIDPYWGGGEVIRLRVAAGSSAIPVGGAAVWNSAFAYSDLPNTANLGQSVAFAASAIPANASYDQYAWFYVSGTFPAFSGASVAANTAVGVTAAGTLGANSAGKQILNARVQAPATTTVVKSNVNTQSGSAVLRVSNSDGWFVGLAITGTGIAASSVISSIDPSGTQVTLNNAATATGSASITGTYTAGSNYWNVVTADRPFAQGAIT